MSLPWMTIGIVLLSSPGRNVRSMSIGSKSTTRVAGNLHVEPKMPHSSAVKRTRTGPPEPPARLTVARNVEFWFWAPSWMVPPVTTKMPPRSFSLIVTVAERRGPSVAAPGGRRLLRVTVNCLSTSMAWLSTSGTVKLCDVTPDSNTTVPAVLR